MIVKSRRERSCRMRDVATSGRAAGVRYEMGIAAKAEDVLALKPDHVLLATGSHMAVPDFVPAEFYDLAVAARQRHLAQFDDVECHFLNIAKFACDL